MKELKIKYKGGYSQVSKYLIREHDANFAVVVDALVNIYNMNIDKLVKIGGESSVKISNGFLSRNTGLGIYIIKANIEKIERIGLVTAVKKGKGNTRHYVIHIDRINTYDVGLKDKFKQWFDDSLESSKKDTARSKEADKIKFTESKNNFERTLATLSSLTEKPTIRLVENQPTKTLKTDQPNSAKPTVVNINKEITIKTTTNRNNVVVDKIFKQENSNGSYIYIKEYDMTIYKKTYEEYIANQTKEDIERKFEEFEQQKLNDSIITDDDIALFDEVNEDAHDLEIDPPKQERRSPISNDTVMMHIYDQAQKLESKKLLQAKRKYETTKDPASTATSATNWKRLDGAYKDLPNIKNQGKFYFSKEDKINFIKLSEFKQEWVIKEVENKKNEATTASRPATYIGEAMKDKLRVLKTQNKRLNVAL
jgi:hypothetical protein